MGAALLQRVTFTPVDLDTKNFAQEPSTPEAMGTKELLQHKHFTPDDFHNRMRAHQKTFTPKDSYADAKLRKTPEDIYTGFRICLYTTRKPLAHGKLYTGFF